MDEIRPDSPGRGPEADDRASERRARGLGPWMAVLLTLALAAGGVLFAGRLRPASPPSDGVSASGSAPGEAAPAAPDPRAAPTDSVIRPEDLPGFESAGLTSRQRLWLYHRAHLEKCSCGCGFTVAECRVEDLSCPVSPGRARELVAEAKRRKS